MTQKELLTTLEVEPTTPAKASVIWMHGLGASGHDFEPIVPELNISESLGIRFIFPHATARPVTLNAGMSMPAWFDIYGLTANTRQDEAGIREAQASLDQLIEKEIERGIQTNKIILAGFSQGGAVALQSGLRFQKPLAGILALSTYLPLADSCPKEISQANKNIPIIMMHGTKDPMLDISLAEKSHDILKTLGYQVNWHTYNMDHSVCLEQIQDIANYLKKLLG